MRPQLLLVALPVLLGPSTEYQPLAVGSTWRYRETTAEGTSDVTLSIVRAAKVGGHKAFVLEVAPEKGEKTTSMLYWTDDGLAQTESTALKFTPPLIELKQPFDLNAEWSWYGTVSIRGAEYPAKANCKIVSKGKLTVPAGTFECVVVRKEVSVEAGGSTISIATTDSYGKGVGWVKGVIDIGGRKTTTELVSYKLAE